MQKSLDFKTVTIPAGTAGNPGTVGTQLPGSLCYIATSSGSFTMQFDASTPFQTLGGFVFNLAPGRFSSQTFFNSSPVPITVTFYIGQIGVAYIGTSNFKEAQTFIIGALGLSATGSYNGQTVTINGDGTVAVPNGAGVNILGLYQGHVRKTLILQVITGDPMRVSDSSGRYVMRITSGTSPVALNSSDNFKLVSEGASGAIISEIYYSL